MVDEPANLFRSPNPSSIDTLTALTPYQRTFVNRSRTNANVARWYRQVMKILSKVGEADRIRVMEATSAISRRIIQEKEEVGL